MLPEVAIHMKQRFVGHYSVGTDTKLATLLGKTVASGSDDGRYCWELKWNLILMNVSSIK
ncbi:hypothetical protein HN51_034169 [Arachis hypogaea]